MEFPNSDSLGLARVICEEEAALIDVAIWQQKVPFPVRIPRERQRFTADLRAVPPEIDVAEPGEIANTPEARPAAPVWSRIPGIREMLEHARQAGVRPLVEGILNNVGRGPRPVVIVGERAELVARLLRWHGRNAIGLSADDGRGERLFPARPKKGSFDHWLIAGANPVDVEAVVFIESNGTRADLAALIEAGSPTPAIIRAHIGADGSTSIDEIIPAAPARMGIAAAPKISVVTVSYNQAAYLEAAIRSVLDQDYPNLEYIIVDGGSTDGSIDIIERFRDRFATVVIEPDRGQSDALNKAFGHATGDILTWLCSDDLLEPNSLRHVSEAFRREHVDLVVGGCVRIGETRRQELQRHHCALPLGQTVRLDAFDVLRFTRSFQLGHYFYQPEVFFSRQIWRRSGAYVKRHLHYGMDYDLWLRMALAGATARHIAPVLACSRVHQQQKTRADHAWYHQFRQIMDEYRDLFAQLEAAARNNSCGSE